MGFRVTARTVLHLGSELISNDGIAIYELIKNALDARSPEVRLNVICRLDFETSDLILRQLGERRHPSEWIQPPPIPDFDWQDLRQTALDSLDQGAPDASELAEAIGSAPTPAKLAQFVRAANYIDVVDDGHGMSIHTLNDVYLTIGTSHRARQRSLAANRNPANPVLGEKGLGRLSAMRLGDTLQVVTAESGSTHWNRLDIDWNDFAQAADEDIGSISITPTVGDAKEPDQQGTLIRVGGLSSAWSVDKLGDLARDHFSKLVDPFGDDPLPLRITYNGDDVPIPEFASFILEHAHGTLEVKYKFGDQPTLSGMMDYRLRTRRRRIRLRGVEMSTLTGDMTWDTLKRVGPFSLQVYWFNRRILTRIDGIGNLAQVRRILANWTGGVSLYRDGYRVNPYGGPQDDWLDLDRHAFSTSGFKLNRGQVVGRANITQSDNPYLTDQTNREGLTEGPESRAFMNLLAAIMEHFRIFIANVDEERRRARRIDANEAITRFRAEDDRIVALLPRLRTALSVTADGRRLASEVAESLELLREAAAAVETESAAQAQERGRVMHLASIGLMIEIIAHELYRATANALATISGIRSRKTQQSPSTSLRVLDAQLKTLQKRLKVLDPLSASARQVKEDFEVFSWIEEIVMHYSEKAEKENIELLVSADPPGQRRQIRAVKGMFAEVIENLLSNSFYWITQKSKFRPSEHLDVDRRGFFGQVMVVVEPNDSRVTVADDGPGIPEDRRDVVFEPFFTTKRQKEGHGLGLYIAREIAEYHGGTLSLGQANVDGMINSVVFTFGSSIND
ncbi:MAG: sensor histidine kinase [Chloroflexota bacterium]|nr:sensor histidine kinase [Chloroflexota bacterium]